MTSQNLPCTETEDWMWPLGTGFETALDDPGALFPPWWFWDAAATEEGQCLQTEKDEKRDGAVKPNVTAPT